MKKSVIAIVLLIVLSLGGYFIYTNNSNKKTDDKIYIKYTDDLNSGSVYEATIYSNGNVSMRVSEVNDDYNKTIVEKNMKEI